MISITKMYVDHKPIDFRRQAHIYASDAPVIAWAARSSRQEDTQSAYSIRVGAWESGWVESADNRVRVPAGIIEKGGYADVSLKLRTAAGDESPEYINWICDARTDWDAKWITDANAERDRPVYLRTSFAVRGEPVRARVYACGLGYHDITINGMPLDDSVLDPAHTDYTRRVCYVMKPEAAHLFKSGANRIEVVVAPGWRDNTQIHHESLPIKDPFPFEGPLVFSAIIEIETKTGRTYRITTDETWEAGKGPVTYANIYNGETYNAGIEPEYGPAAIAEAPAGRLEPMLLSPVQEQDYITPVAVWPDGENAFIADFGRNFAGVVNLTLPEEMEKGQKITITHSEELTEDGRLFRDTLRAAKAEDNYIASGDENDLEVWQPRYVYHGFRYARVEGMGFDIGADSILGVALYTDVDNASMFTCGNALITKIHDIAVNTERSNIHSILTDCPQRNERAAWMNDATVRFEETPYNFDISALFPKVVHDLMDVQSEDGAITCTAPYVWGGRPADPVCSSFLVAGLMSAMHTGNLDIIKEAYPSFRAWEDCLLAHSTDYVVDYSYYGDWAGPADSCVPGDGVNPGAASGVTPGQLMSTGYSYYNSVQLAKFADWLGMPEAAQAHRDTAEKIKAAFIEKWYDAETGSFATGSQGSLTFPLWLGIAPEPEKTALRLHEKLIADGWRLTTGNLCSRYIMEVLCDNGYVEDAWTLMTREEYPSIGFMIQQEATTVWERFELMKAPGMNSHNHPMYGAVDYWMYAYLAGVKCTGPGWKRISVKPYMPEKLMSAQATVDTVLGPVSVRWTKRYGGKHLQLTVPFGATADIDFCGVKKTVGCGFHTITVED